MKNPFHNPFHNSTKKGNIVITESNEVAKPAPGQSGLELMGQIKPAIPVADTAQAGTVYQRNPDGSFTPVGGPTPATAPAPVEPAKPVTYQQAPDGSFVPQVATATPTAATGPVTVATLPETLATQVAGDATAIAKTADPELADLFDDVIKSLMTISARLRG
jgi:hypothetical protein